VNKQKNQDLTWETSFDQIVNATNQGEIRIHHPWILFMLRFGEVYQKLMRLTHWAKPPIFLQSGQLASDL